MPARRAAASSSMPAARSADASTSRASAPSTIAPTSRDGRSGLTSTAMAPSPEAGQERRDQLGRVEEHEDDPVAGRDPPRLQPASGRRDERLEILVGDRRAVDPKGRSGAVARRRRAGRAATGRRSRSCERHATRSASVRARVADVWQECDATSARARAPLPHEGSRHGSCRHPPLRHHLVDAVAVLPVHLDHDPGAGADRPVPRP